MKGRKTNVAVRFERAQHFKRMRDRGTPITAIACFYELSPRTILRELKWLRERG